ncbi:hypothetical protein [Modestobacter italicus]|uniref:hypothetical protein n=1 Tax=Modestobacter italicus (strain DSM 44449 / CECT 9708 / BC 501) TaxID=2732864 RepID=UPI001C9738B6|nr:hypothetical protein [Modestobacter italicus]
MSQPHPPIPEPQPHREPSADGDDAAGTGTGSTAASQAEDPRTQSILLPPSQRSEAQPESEEAGPQPGQGPHDEARPGDWQPGEWQQSATAPVPGLAGTPGPDEPVATGHPATGPIAAQSAPTQTAPAHGAQTSGAWTPSAWTPSAPTPSDQPSADRPSAPEQPGPAPDTAPTGPYQPYQPSYDTSRMTGPVDLGADVAGDPTIAEPPPATPGPATATGLPPAAPANGGRRSALSAVRDRPLLIGAGLVGLALVLLQLGLVLDFGNQSLWEVVPTWSTFATVGVVLLLVPFLAPLVGQALSARTAWRVAAGGLTALAATWVLVALPLAASDRGFWLTAALGAGAAALWLSPGRGE